VENITWYQAVRYCNARSVAEARMPAYDTSLTDSVLWVWNRNSDGYRLPTEAEWEYAARGGSTDDWYWGPYVNPGNVSPNAWYAENSGGTTHPVGTLSRNRFGLRDVSGNVWEWVWDWASSPYPATAQTEPAGPDHGDKRVIRGGGWDGSAIDAAQTNRSFVLPYSSWASIGFRCAAGRVP
jgi:formylglycine-generating enzyme required for sulfatase activity